MSRPRKTEAARMSRRITFRVTQAEYDRLTIKAKSLSLSAAQFARKLALDPRNKIVLNTYKRFDPAYIAQLKRIGNNLNQLVKNAHVFKRVSPRVDLLLEDIRAIIFMAIDEEFDD
ncbi:MAG: plasmid mobilization relaxosome protein MobC [Verrucomicrobiota bacterium]